MLSLFLAMWTDLPSTVKPMTVNSSLDNMPTQYGSSRFAGLSHTPAATVVTATADGEIPHRYHPNRSRIVWQVELGADTLASYRLGDVHRGHRCSKHVMALIRGGCFNVPIRRMPPDLA